MGTRPACQRRWARLAATGWIAAIALLWLAWLVEIPAASGRARSAHVMCSGLPDFSRLAAALPTGGPVLFVSDRDSFQEAGEAFFCARYALSPLPLHFRTREEVMAAPALTHVLLVDLGRAAGATNLLAMLRRQATARGVELDVRPGPPGVWVVRERS